MKRRRILYQWLGHADLRAMAVSLPSADRDELFALIKSQPSNVDDQGPGKTLVTNEVFDEIYILSNYPPKWNGSYLDWLGAKAYLRPVELPVPTSYAAIFQLAHASLDALKKRTDWPEIQLCLHLSPGTPAMAAIWLLLGKTLYPATFYETFEGQSWVTEVPFDLTIDVLPAMLRNQDAHLAYLSAQSPSEVEGFGDIVGDSRAIRDAVGRARRAALRGVNVLLLGESGTGKELFARAIHRASPRRDNPFIAINCAALSKTLLESELFGHKRGAFTGADRDRRGAFEQAHTGTLFLDEISECDAETQAKLLRVLQPLAGEGPTVRTIRRLGDDCDVHIDARIIAATNRDLQQSIAQQSFRDDLYYRLAAISITIPALRHRRSDIPAIAQRLMEQINNNFAQDELTYQPKLLADSALSFLSSHGWPGNVRQLYNVLAQAAVLADGTALDRASLTSALGEISAADSLADDALLPLGDGFNLEEHMNQIQRSYLKRAMQEAGGVKARAARLLGIKSYQTLDAQLKRLDLDSNWHQ
ncbi:MAG: sigma-54 interaction domain-containing protein [Planctomycetota bacterium]